MASPRRRFPVSCQDFLSLGQRETLAAAREVGNRLGECFDLIAFSQGVQRFPKCNELRLGRSSLIRMHAKDSQKSGLPLGKGNERFDGPFQLLRFAGPDAEVPNLGVHDLRNPIRCMLQADEIIRWLLVSAEDSIARVVRVLI